jgi:hypothetical protein
VVFRDIFLIIRPYFLFAFVYHNISGSSGLFLFL